MLYSTKISCSAPYIVITYYLSIQLQRTLPVELKRKPGLSEPYESHMLLCHHPQLSVSNMKDISDLSAHTMYHCLSFQARTKCSHPIVAVVYNGEIKHNLNVSMLQMSNILYSRPQLTQHLLYVI